MNTLAAFLLLAVTATQGFVLSGGQPAVAFNPSVLRSAAVSASDFYPQEYAIVNNHDDTTDDKAGASCCPFAAFLDSKKQQQQQVVLSTTRHHYGDTTTMKRRENPNVVHGIVGTVLFMFFRMIIRPEDNNNNSKGPTQLANKQQQPKRGEDLLYNLVANVFVGFVGIIAKPLSRVL